MGDNLIDVKTTLARQFSIISKDNVETPLSGGDFFAHDPQGLGVELNNDISILNSIMYLSSQNYSIKDISFKVVCGSKTRPAYANFLYLCKQFKGGTIKLKYIIPEVGTFYRDVAIKSITKTELQRSGVIDETFTFEPLSFWYQIEEYSFTPTKLGDTSYTDLDEYGVSSVTLNFDVPVISNLYFRNELFIQNISDDENIEAPGWYCSHDKSHPGIDGYNLILEPGESLVTGNLDGGTYAYYTMQNGTRNVLSHQMPRCMTPLCLKDGSNTITMNIESHNNYIVRIRTKVEYPIL